MQTKVEAALFQLFQEQSRFDRLDTVDDFEFGEPGRMVSTGYLVQLLFFFGGCESIALH